MSLVGATATYLLLRGMLGREVAFGIAFFIYAAIAWPGFRILARLNGHGISPVLYFLAFGIAAIVLMVT